MRSGNEDSGYAGRSLFVVADGMGGHAAGEVASRTVVAAMLGLDGADLGPDIRATLGQAVDEANERLRLAVDARPDLEGMGTTLTALAWDGERMAVAHVGDSRAYLLRDGRLTMLTHDQTLVQTLVDEGRITEEEARTHPQHAVILQALDGRRGLDPDLDLLEPQAGDRFLVCSDGLTSYVQEDAVREVLAGREAHAALDGLIGLALEAGAPDNVTVIVVDVLEGAADVPDDPQDAATHAPGGVLVGAVGETVAASTLAVEDPAAGLTTDDADARLGRHHRSTLDALARDDDSSDRRPGRRRRWPWLVVLLIAVLAGGVVAAKAWTADQWYVGVDNGNVAIYSGVDVSLGPIALSSLSQRTALETATLPEFAREEVEGGIAASSRAEAEATVARLQLAADACLSAPETVGCP